MSFIGYDPGLPPDVYAPPARHCPECGETGWGCWDERYGCVLYALICREETCDDGLDEHVHLDDLEADRLRNGRFRPRCPDCRRRLTEWDHGEAQLCVDCTCRREHGCKDGDAEAPCAFEHVLCVCRGSLGTLHPLPSCTVCWGTGRAERQAVERERQERERVSYREEDRHA